MLTDEQNRRLKILGLEHESIHGTPVPPTIWMKEITFMDRAKPFLRALLNAFVIGCAVIQAQMFTLAYTMGILSAFQAALMCGLVVLFLCFWTRPRSATAQEDEDE